MLAARWSAVLSLLGLCSLVVCQAQVQQPGSLRLAAEQASELCGAKLVDVEDVPGGKAILVQEAYGRARWGITVADGRQMPPGLYDVTVTLGSAAGGVKCAGVQRLPVFREGWYAGLVRGEEAGKVPWRQFKCTCRSTGKVRSSSRWLPVARRTSTLGMCSWTVLSHSGLSR